MSWLQFTRLLFLLCIGALSQPALACDKVSLPGDSTLLLENFDTFAVSATSYPKNLKLELTGDCQMLQITVAREDTFSPQFPTLAVYSDNTLLFSSTTPDTSPGSVTLAAVGQSRILPLTFNIATNATLAPGIRSTRLKLIVVAGDGVQEPTRFELPLTLDLEIADILRGGFGGVTQHQFTQQLDLDLGRLEQGKVSKPVLINVFSNLGYEVQIDSRFHGKLMLENPPQGVTPSSVAYQVIYDGTQYDISSDPAIIDGAKKSAKRTPNQHEMQIKVTGDPTKVRAGRYADTVVIDIRQKP